MKILSIETSQNCICTSYLKNKKICCKKIKKYKNTSMYILDIIEYMLKKKKRLNLNTIIFCHGPGKFVGTRLSSSIVKAFSFSSKIPIIKLSMIHIYASIIRYNILFRNKIVLILYPFSKKKYFCSLFKISNNIVIRLSEDKIRTLDQINNYKNIKNMIIFCDKIKNYDIYSQIKDKIYFCKEMFIPKSSMLLKTSYFIHNFSIYKNNKGYTNNMNPSYLN